MFCEGKSNGSLDYEKNWCYNPIYHLFLYLKSDGIINQKEVCIIKKQRKPLNVSPTDLYHEAQRRLDELLEIRNSLEVAIDKAPPGRIHVLKSARRTQYYLRECKSDKTGRYLPKSNPNSIKIYLQKAYNQKAIKLISTEISNLEYLLNNSNEIELEIQNLYSQEIQDIKERITPIAMSDEDYAALWLSELYVGKEFNDDTTFFETNNKERVRSKSELTIANALAKHHIPYKYERPLSLKCGTTIYPDFTVLNVKTRREIYWEHRGMMDDEYYAVRAVRRFKVMQNDDIILGKNLIITEETASNPLGTNEIEKIIQSYFL